jgi:hypothetical protein
MRYPYTINQFVHTHTCAHILALTHQQLPTHWSSAAHQRERERHGPPHPGAAAALKLACGRPCAPATPFRWAPSDASGVVYTRRSKTPQSHVEQNNHHHAGVIINT